MADGDLKLSDSPNVDTGLVEKDGSLHRVILTAEPEGILQLSDSANVSTGYVTDNQGKKHKVQLTASLHGGGSSLPDQTGNAGKFLTTDGTDASWGTVETLPTQTGNNGKFLKTNGTTASWGSAVENIANGQRSFIVGGDYTNSVNDFISIGYSTSSTVTSFGTYCVQIGGYSKTGNIGGTAIGYSSGASGVRCTAVGYSCGTGSGYYNTGLGALVSISGANSVAIGAHAQASDSSVSIGGGANNSTSAEATNNSIAIGYNAHAKATKSIQLGEGTNSTANTFSVANTNGNYTMMDANGKIPADRLGTGYDPTKTQTLKNVQGVLTWVDD